jgi:hypothetical protein
MKLMPRLFLAIIAYSLTLAICWLDGPPFISRQFFPDRTPES